MGEIRDGFWNTYRDFETVGVPASGDHDPIKSEIRALALPIEAGIAAAALSGTDLTAAMTLVAPLLTSAEAAQSAAEGALSAALATVAGVEAAVADQIDDAVAGATLTAEGARDDAQAAATQAANSFSSVDALANMYPSQAAGEAAVTNGYFTFVDGGGNIVYVRRVSGVSTIISPGAFITLSGSQDVTGTKTFKGGQRFATNGSRIGITDDATPITPQALFNVVNKGSTTNGLRVTSYWTGSTGAPYQNNDNSLWETFNKALSDSENYSWSISAPNGYNDIPVGVHDSGERVGVYGWAVSVNIAGQYVHAGRLTSQIGVRGRAGFQGIGTPATAVIDRSVGVLGEIRADAVNATIADARAGYFTSVIGAGTGIAQNNTGVYAEASGGTIANWAYFGAAGMFYNRDRAYFGDGSFTAAQSVSNISTRGAASNAVEFGNGDPGGYGSNIGATAASGNPFVALCCEADPTGNTFRTRGKAGSIIRGDLAGAVLFSRVTNVNASGQTPTDDVIWRPDGKFLFTKNQRWFGTPPATATSPGEQWEVSRDADYLYLCVADNTWKRVALATW